LGDPTVADDGLVDIQFEIARGDPAPVGEAIPAFRPPRIALQVGSSEASSEALRVYLTVWNPDATPITRVTATLYYNPRELTPLDGDRGNWVRAGVNVCDGPYHEAFPFDFHNANAIDTAQGRIVYDMGAMRRPVRSRGVFAHVDFSPVKGVGRSIVLLAEAQVGTSRLAPISRRGDRVGSDALVHDSPRDWVVLDFAGD